ncbi:MAG TPA: 1-(5-phosphoribosyl)-5-amino-4-imidazole-carboxylate carboxylase, partial [Acidimicrobiales bacterium]|nr:1-(5-phosphoribosyl)-5-amino-4-imidazole-carboxylate carboxylase [Acidimicrobiales bacterium]
MDEAALQELLGDVRSGRVDDDEAVRRLRRLPFADLGFARVDHHRALRQGVAEAVYAPGKTPQQCA